MSNKCSHLNTIKKVTPSARGCEECLKTGSTSVHRESAAPADMWVAAINRRAATRRATIGRLII